MINKPLDSGIEQKDSNVWELEVDNHGVDKKF